MLPAGGPEGLEGAGGVEDTSCPWHGLGKQLPDQPPGGAPSLLHGGARSAGVRQVRGAEGGVGIEGGGGGSISKLTLSGHVSHSGVSSILVSMLSLYHKFTAVLDIQERSFK